MSKQTAVNYITQGLEKLRHKFDQDTILTLQYLIIEAKQMEKKQIVDAHLLGLLLDLTKDAETQAEEYYNENYGGDYE